MRPGFSYLSRRGRCVPRTPYVFRELASSDHADKIGRQSARSIELFLRRRRDCELSALAILTRAGRGGAWRGLYYGEDTTSGAENAVSMTINRRQMIAMIFSVPMPTV